MVDLNIVKKKKKKKNVVPMLSALPKWNIRSLNSIGVGLILP